MKKLLLLLLLCGAGVLSGCERQRPAASAVNLILDTDLGPDYDDVGAMALMHALADSGQVNILATVSSNRDSLVVPCIEAINGYFHRADIPVGAPKGAAPSLTSWHSDGRWTEYVPANFAHATASTADAPDAVEVYREVLAAAPDSSVTICTIGFFSNLKALLESGPDRFSDLSGRELVARKVRSLVSMAGKFPSGAGEFNVKCDAPAAAAVVGEWPGDIVFSGFEIGRDILTGKEVAAMNVEGSPVRDTYAMCLRQDNPEGRNSWDQTAVLVAIKGHAPYFKLRRGTVSVDSVTGANTWTDSSDGRHAYLVKALSDGQLASIIEGYMKHQPM